MVDNEKEYVKTRPKESNGTGDIVENSSVVVEGENHERIDTHEDPVKIVEEEGPIESVYKPCSAVVTEKYYEERHCVPSCNAEIVEAPKRSETKARERCNRGYTAAGKEVFEARFARNYL